MKFNPIVRVFIFDYFIRLSYRGTSVGPLKIGVWEHFLPIAVPPSTAGDIINIWISLRGHMPTRCYAYACPIAGNLITNLLIIYPTITIYHHNTTVCHNRRSLNISIGFSLTLITEIAYRRMTISGNQSNYTWEIMDQSSKLPSN